MFQQIAQAVGGGGGGEGGGGGAGFLGSVGMALFQDYRSRRAAATAHDWSREDAAINRSWQERMASSAHQREVDDLRKAGLNPILSATGGAGAATPSGNMAESEAADVPDYQAAMSTALEYKMANAQQALMKAQGEQASSAADFNKALKAKTEAETKILGPKSLIYDKIEEGLKSIAEPIKNKVKEWKEGIRESDPKAPSAPVIMNNRR